MIDLTMEENGNVTFRLQAIENAKYEPAEGIESMDFEEKKLLFQFKIDTEIKFSEDIILVIPQIRYSYEGKIIVSASAEFVYAVPGLQSVILVDNVNRQINVKADIFPSLVGTAYSTLRGIVYSNSIGTSLARFPLPMIETQTLVEKNGITVSENNNQES